MLCMCGVAMHGRTVTAAHALSLLRQDQVHADDGFHRLEFWFGCFSFAALPGMDSAQKSFTKDPYELKSRRLLMTH